MWGGGGKKKLEQTPLPAKNIGTKDGHGKRNRTSSITVEGRIWLSPNSRDCAREWWWAAECTSSRRKPDIPEALSGGDSGTLALSPENFLPRRAVFVRRRDKSAHACTRLRTTRLQKTSIASRNPCRFLLAPVLSALTKLPTDSPFQTRRD